MHTSGTIVAIEAIEADGRGSISGFKLTCPACGYVWTTSLETIARNDATDHVAFMLAKEAHDVAPRARRPRRFRTSYGWAGGGRRS